ncbi:MAG: alkaline phosphatase family protein [Planctomycetes bacterium]|nr:alkaline phosphatase family protein [Planctomycetota bacterium]
MRSILTVFVLFGFAAAGLTGAEKAEHVVVVIWDGLRPDSMSEQHTPNLYKLAARGAFFSRNHSSLLTSTEVNGTVIATGCYPAHSTVIANVEYRAEIDALKTFATEDLETIRKVDGASQGKYLRAATLAEILRGAKRTTAVAGTKPVALLLDRAERSDSAGAAGGYTVFESRTLPASLAKQLAADLGPFPPPADATKEANREEDLWTTRAFLEKLCGEKLPDFSMLWLSEVDFAQHGAGPGSAPALAGLKSSDDCLGLVLKKLEDRGLLDKTDVFVVSDHGFSTIMGTVGMTEALAGEGFKASKEFKAAPQKGEILVIGQGGSVCFYVTGHDKEVVEKLVAFLQQQYCASAVFTREPAKGAFPLSAVHLDSPAAPDVVLGLKWNAGKSVTGMPGMLLSEGSKRKPGQGTHASFSAFDIHNTLIAAGPDFKKGYVDEFPTGNVDVAPTVLAIFGVEPPAPMDGRVLGEALVFGETPKGAPESATQNAECEHEKSVWKQFLKSVKFADRTYIEEAGGSSTVK